MECQKVNTVGMCRTILRVGQPQVVFMARSQNGLFTATLPFSPILATYLERLVQAELPYVIIFDRPLDSHATILFALKVTTHMLYSWSHQIVSV